MRQQLLPESGAISQLAMSAMDDWGAAIRETDAPALVIIEGLTMYLSEADVRRIFEVIAARLPKAEVFVETMNPAVAKRFKERSIEAVAAFITAERPSWSGTATELAAVLQVDMKPNALAMRLNVRAGKLATEYHIRYENTRTHAGRSISLTLEPPQA